MNKIGLQGFGLNRLWQKLALLAVISLPAIGYVTWLYVSEKNVSIEFGQKEIYGANYLPPLKRVYEGIAAHRAGSVAYPKGNTAASGLLSSSEQKVKDGLRALDEIDGRAVAGTNYGALLGTRELLSNLKREWEDARARGNSGRPQDSFEAHSKAVNTARDLITRVGDNSNLILDPDIDSYYAMDAVIIQLPNALDGLDQVRSVLAGAAASDGRALTTEDQTILNYQLARAQDALKNVRVGIGKSLAFNPSLDGQLGQAVVQSLSGAEIFLKKAEGWARTGKVDSSSDQVLSEAGKSLDSLAVFYDTTHRALNGLLEIRIGTFKRSLYLALASVLVAFVFTFGFAFFTARGVTKQVNELTTLVGELDKGNVDARASIVSADELGLLARSFNNTLESQRGLMQSVDERDQIQRSIMRLLDEVSEVARGDLRREAQVTEDVTGAIADSFNYMIVELRRIISKVQDVTVQVASAASQTVQTTAHVAEGSEAQTQQILHTTEAINQMAVSINQVSENATVSAEVAKQALVNARQGADAVNNTIQGMSRIREQVQETAKRIKHLGESSQEIGEIVQLIEDIADRTSILALNASIQAAMAGEAGRGFAVVAEEVERLAERSAGATRKISDLVRAIQVSTNEAISAMEESTREVVEGSHLAVQAGQALGEIENVSNRLAGVIESIKVAAKQQSHSSEQVTSAMNQIAEITQQTAAGVRQSSVTVNGLAELADELRDSVASFKLPENQQAFRSAAS
jgi:twitching motility protein PilJ